MTETPRQSVYRVVYQIPRGKVLSYGAVAHYAGLGRAARFVGNTMRNLPPDTELPWHRVISSQGKISLPEHHPGRKKQLELLANEGVEVFKGKIDLKKYAWQP